jgi:hypothetical protein
MPSNEEIRELLEADLRVQDAEQFPGDRIRTAYIERVLHFMDTGEVKGADHREQIAWGSQTMQGQERGS